MTNEFGSQTNERADRYWAARRKDWYAGDFGTGRIADFTSATIALPRVSHTEFPSYGSDDPLPPLLVTSGTRAPTARALKYGGSMDEHIARSRLVGNHVRASLGQLLSMPGKNIWLDANTTSSFRLALRGLAPKQPRILTTDQEYASINAVIDEHISFGGSVEKIDGRAANVVDALEAYDKPFDIFVVSAVTQARCEILPVNELRKITQAQGAKIIVDGAQAIGHIPFNGAVGYDAVVGCGHKWLHGRTITGFAAFREPAHLNMFLGSSYLSAPDAVLAVQSDAERSLRDKLEFDGDQISSVADLAQSLVENGQVGWSRHFARIDANGAYLREQLEHVPGVELTVRSAPAPGMIPFKTPGLDHASVAHTLGEVFGVYVRHDDIRNILRASTDPTVTHEQLDRLILGLSGITQHHLPIREGAIHQSLFHTTRNAPFLDEVGAAHMSRVTGWPAYERIVGKFKDALRRSS